MIDLTEGRLDSVLLFAESINDNSLKNCIESLKRAEKNLNCETELYNDFADKSFYFVRKKCGKFIGNGGVIWHGGNKNTFSVTITKTKNWMIHT